ncbi:MULTISPECIES: DUF2231 domain-containing protein [Rhizobium]|uniref:DUF2231 domain-containing protein n=1 Tax=Rhizobium rhododendri TaxID=2506430 RepID=A0ABY8IEY9_9HYPH|nr:MULTISPECIES: DUF2231 domain-containing protein [Rhizobium]MBZ5759061.1 DUF2231 domain-containing protein [Rhizobium sp. VS19-DR96]MBZ5764109.1 DUF2231 domain-containing protein [Rhizobium sp. VS19-DR129.2]MBZ5771652.1 DUF2231 domain-containing protein [Rhizobium sp. VS19-DRK62.2]MBZ5783661.1 DUF2231 domain-containing protein [Rhizobium sp. VS19-DR121]MBZ5801665.1 DUF2231 domain-containing protein [Rhizobium sp. VS19-DR181]
MTNPIIYPVRIVKPPLFPILWHFALACFIGTMITDITYWRTAEMMWANFSAWLLTAGLMVGAVAALVCLVDFFVGRLVGVNRLSAIYVLGNGVALVLAIFNALIHSRDAWTSVVPMGLVLSAATLIVLILGGLLGRTPVYRQDLGVVE